MPSAEEDLAAIAGVRDQLTSALESGDVPGIMAGLTSDHLTMPPDGQTPPDNAALTIWHQTSHDLYSFNGDFTTDDIQIYGDLAIERWSGNTRLVPKGEGEEISDSTKGVWIWKRQEDGSWKLLWSIWNSNLPAEGMPTPG
jgi:ketosteroid isomerase-like protein